MQTKSRQIILNCGGLLLAAGLQIRAGQWRIFFDQRTAIGEFGASTLWLAIVEILLGFASGILLALVLFPKANTSPDSKAPGVVIAFGVLLPLAAIGMKMSAALGNYILLPINLGVQFVIWEWAIKSGLPAVWLGMAIVALNYWLKQRR